MMQCGMFVPAASFRANVCDGLFTHFKREEDTSMRSGKLDEELSRMSAIIDNITPHSIVLLNESFASTNEREGAEIARQIVRALLERGVKVCYVTHLFDLAQGFTARRWTPPCSFVQNGWPTGGERFDLSKASRCRRAMAKICIGGSSGRFGPRDEGRNKDVHFPARFAFRHFREGGRYIADRGAGCRFPLVGPCATCHFLKTSRILWTPRMPTGMPRTSTGLGDSGSRISPIQRSG